MKWVKKRDISKSGQKAQLQFTKHTYLKASPVLCGIEDIFVHALSTYFRFIPVHCLMKFREVLIYCCSALYRNNVLCLIFVNIEINETLFSKSYCVLPILNIVKSSKYLYHTYWVTCKLLKYLYYVSVLFCFPCLRSIADVLDDFVIWSNNSQTRLFFLSVFCYIWNFVYVENIKRSYLTRLKYRRKYLTSIFTLVENFYQNVLQYQIAYY